jgi:large subunit ribosomal protein L23
MSAIFSKKNKDSEEKNDLKIEEASKTTEGQPASISFSGTGGANAHKILRGFYVSEKSSLGQVMSQYTFEVFKGVNKNEVKKEVAKLFNVKVKSVRILNMPEKRRDFGKHPGSKSGFKKAIVMLEKGYTIGQAKP